MSHTFLIAAFIFSITVSAVEKKFCDKEILPQKVDSLFCPETPTRKNGRKCYAANPIDLNHHTTGYAEFITEVIQKTIEETQRLSFSQHGVDPTLMMAVLAKESWLNPMSTNSWGDIGIAQFQPATAQATVDYMRELELKVPEKISLKTPPGCSPNKYSTPLSKRCFKAIKKHCSTEAYSNSLYCPQFGLRLMAFHFLQIQDRQVMVKHQDVEYDAALLLTPEGDEESRLRHLASVYNRGFRIYNSAFHYFINNQKWPIAKDHGPLWNTKRTIDRSNDPFEGGTLFKHYINRCYVWAITGLCGGIKNSAVHKYTQRMCSQTSSSSNPSLAFLNHKSKKSSFEFYRNGKLLESLQELKKNSFFLSRDDINLALSLYEGSSAISTPTISEILAKEVRELSFNEAQTALDKNRILSFTMSREEVDDRYLQLRLLKVQAKRNWQTTGDREWLYLAGMSGFYLHGGAALLREYSKTCYTDSSQCKRVLRLLKIKQEQDPRLEDQ